MIAHVLLLSFSNKKSLKFKFSHSQLGLSTQPVYPSNPPQPEPKTARTDTPMVGGGWPPLELDAFRSVGRFPLPKPEQPDLIINPETSNDIRRIFDKNLQRPAVLEFSGKGYLKSHQIRRDLPRSSPDPA